MLIEDALGEYDRSMAYCESVASEADKHQSFGMVCMVMFLNPGLRETSSFQSLSSAGIQKSLIFAALVAFARL